MRYGHYDNDENRHREYERREHLMLEEDLEYLQDEAKEQPKKKDQGQNSERDGLETKNPTTNGQENAKGIETNSSSFTEVNASLETGELTSDNHENVEVGAKVNYLLKQTGAELLSADTKRSYNWTVLNADGSVRVTKITNNPSLELEAQIPGSYTIQVELMNGDKPSGIISTKKQTVNAKIGDEEAEGLADKTKKAQDSESDKKESDNKKQTSKSLDTASVASSSAETADDTIYVVSDSKTNLYSDKLEKTEDTIPKWTEVKVKETKIENKKEYALIKASDDSKEYGWCLKSNLYSLSWNPKEKEIAYKSISTAYNDQMQKVDSKENYKKLKLSGSETFGIVDKLYPNSTDVNLLDADFKTKYEKLKKCFEDNGISIDPSAGLRHPLRSTIFNYAISVKKTGDEDIIHEANAVCRKYGIPIDWAHKNKEGKIDLAESKLKAETVCKAFGITDLAARGVKDFGGTISNHNSGKAVDIKLTFSFAEKKKIKYNEKEFEIDPISEKKKPIKNIKESQLTLLGKEASDLNRTLDNDPIHWSEAGN